MENIKFEKDLVSIIIPVYNEENYLIDCIKSFQNQTYRNIEIILVDDGSTNSASEICDNCAREDTRIKVIHKHNEGLSSARITGLKQAKGEWITFSDHDDLVSKDLIKHLISENKPDIDIITGGRIDFSEISPRFDIKDNGCVNILTGRDACEKLPFDEQKTLITPMWGKLYRHTFLKSLDLEKYKEICPVIYFEDVLATPIIYSKARKIAVVHRKMYAHREVATSISRSGKLSEFYFDQIESGKILLNYCKNNGLEKYYSYQLSIYFRSILRIFCLMDYDNTYSEYDPKKMKQKIIKYYDIYIHDYFKVGHDSLLEKLLIRMFRIFPAFWAKLAYAVYFKQHNLRS